MKISVALCTYNGAKYIEEQLNSILKQTLLPDEIVICDDSSTDDTVFVTRQALAKYTGELVLRVNPRNIGYKKNFVNAMSLCTGEIIFLSDQDDVWEKNKIALVNQSFKDNPRAILVFHDAVLVDEQLKLLYNSFWKTIEFNPERFLCHDYNILLEKNVVQGSACAFRKNLFHKAIPFPIVAIHDEWLALVAVGEGEIIPIAQQLMQYRQGNNVLGGRPTAFVAKIKKWTINIKKVLNIYLQELVRREAVYNTYSQKKHANKGLAKRFDFISCSKFLENRVQYINNGDLSIIKLFPTYVGMHISITQAIKVFLKDLLVMFFYDKKSL